MIKNFVSSLWSSKQENKLENDDIKVLLPELPFYGVSGTICRVEETPDSYYKILYNQDGTVNSTKIPVPKKKTKNLKLLLNDYYADLANYLEVYRFKYLEMENSTATPILTNKQFYALVTVTSLAAIASIPFLFATAWAGIIFGTISIFSLYMVCEVHQKDVTLIRNKEIFQKEYKIFERNLSDYRAGNPLNKEKLKETTYTEIDSKDNSNVRTFPKIKVLS